MKHRNFNSFPSPCCPLRLKHTLASTARNSFFKTLNVSVQISLTEAAVSLGAWFHVAKSSFNLPVVAFNF